jgi:hypothetical protein
MMRSTKLALQAVFYTMILTLLVSNSVTSVISHDENQFIAPGQLLMYHGSLPYVDYPYTHMPYAALFYAATAGLSGYDFLAGRLMNCVVWLVCGMLMVSIARAIRADTSGAIGKMPSFRQLLGEFAIVFLFISHPLAAFILNKALNHAFATLFSLLALWFFVRGVRDEAPDPRFAFWSGMSIAAAGFIRFNYASLGVVLLACWLIRGHVLRRARRFEAVPYYLGGFLLASIPVLVLIGLAPSEFYYGNLVYIRLNTVYFEQLLFRTGMDVAGKLGLFLDGIYRRPIDVVLYGVLVYTAAASILRLARLRAAQYLGMFAAAGFAGALWLTALAPTPTLGHYFAATLPFLFLLLASFGPELRRWAQPAQAVAILTLVLAAVSSIELRKPLAKIAALAQPSLWPPVQVHDFGEGLKLHADNGKILTLQPMIPMEAGFDVYRFTATGPFSWRTSLFLTPARRAHYRVTGPQELAELLNQSRPAAILTGFEAPNSGFERNDPGGLETPFADYALANGYQPTELVPPFWQRGVTLWVREP